LYPQRFNLGILCPPFRTLSLFTVLRVSMGLIGSSDFFQFSSHYCRLLLFDAGFLPVGFLNSTLHFPFFSLSLCPIVPPSGTIQHPNQGDHEVPCVAVILKSFSSLRKLSFCPIDPLSFFSVVPVPPPLTNLAASLFNFCGCPFFHRNQHPYGSTPGRRARFLLFFFFLPFISPLLRPHSLGQLSSPSNSASSRTRNVQVFHFLHRIAAAFTAVFPIRIYPFDSVLQPLTPFSSGGPDILVFPARVNILFPTAFPLVLALPPTYGRSVSFPFSGQSVVQSFLVL